MESKKRKRSAATTAGLELANKRIAYVKEKCLPMMPHLLEVPMQHRIIHREFPFENMDIPPMWTRAEYEHMQYMTFVNESDRGFTTTRGAWEDDMNIWGLSPEQAATRSSSGTPNPFNQKKPTKKMSYKDYKIFKETGVMPPSKPSSASPTPDPQNASANSGGPNAASLSNSLAQVLSSETSAANAKKADTDISASSVNRQQVSSKDVKMTSAQSSQTSGARETAGPTLNGISIPSNPHKPIRTTNGVAESASQDAATADTLAKPRPQKGSLAAANGLTKSARTQGHPVASGSVESSVQAKPLGVTSGTVEARLPNKPLPANGIIESARKEQALPTTNGAGSSASRVKPTTIRNAEAPTSQKPAESASKDRPVTNGTAPRDALQSKETNKDITRPKQQAERPSMQHALPKKPASVIIKKASPPHKNLLGIYERPGVLKRFSPPSDNAPPEKRAKIEHSITPSGHSRTPSNPQNSLPRKPDPSGLPPKPKVSAGPTSNPSPRPKVGPPPKVGNKDIRKSGTPKPDTPKSEMSRDLPPILSPLRANFESSPLSEPPSSSVPSGFSNNSKKQEDKTSSVKKAITAKSDKDKFGAKKQVERSASPEVPNANVSRPIPRLLSPDLPPVVEKALAQIKKKKHETVEERHESVRRANAPGVARKTVKPKASKKTVAAPEPTMSDEPEEVKDELVVRLKYKKRQAKDIQRVLNLRPQPKYPVESSAFAKDDDSSDDDVPLAKTASKAPVSSMKKKRPAEVTAPEPAPKRAKADKMGAARTSTPVPSVRTSTPLPAARTSTPVPSTRHDSPAPSVASNKNLLSTPKKGDAMRSVAMRKVDSSDGLARTPQPTMISTPASAEKGRVNASTSEPRSQLSPEIEKIRSDEKKCQVLALKIKRKMDEVLKTKIHPRPEVSEKDRKVGVATGLECLVVYMNAFVLSDRLNTLSNHPRNHKPWVEINNLRVYLERESAEFPALQALSHQLGAICKDQLERSYMDNGKDNHKHASFWDALEKNSKSKNQLWAKAEEMRGAVEPFGGAQILTPGSDIKQITTYTIGVLTAYSRTNSTGWKKDPEISTVFS